MDREAFQTDSQTTLITVCFVSPPPPRGPTFSVLRQTSEEHSQNKKELALAQRTLALGHTGNRALFLSFYPSAIWSRLPSTVQNALRPLELAHLNWTDVSFMVFFHFRDGYWALIGYQAHLSASVSSLPLFSFLLSEDSSSLSGPPHMLRVTSCRANNSPTFPRRDSGCCHRSLAHMCKWLMESFGNKFLSKGNFFCACFLEVMFFFCRAKRYLQFYPFPSQSASPSLPAIHAEMSAMDAIRTFSSMPSFHPFRCVYGPSAVSQPSPSSGTAVFVDVALLRIWVAKRNN